MKFFLENKEIENTIGEIRSKIRNSMNGEVSASMRNHGIIYKRNYGVNIPRIKEISKLYAPNHDLAQRLWALKIRETMILATLLEPIEKFSEENAKNWLQDVNQNELAEQITMNLFSKLPFAKELAIRWIFSEEIWSQIVGFMLITRVWKQFQKEEIRKILNRAIELSGVEEFQLYKSISTALSRLSRHGDSVSKLILQRTKDFADSIHYSQRYILNELKDEISFLDF